MIMEAEKAAETRSPAATGEDTAKSPAATTAAAAAVSENSDEGLSIEVNIIIHIKQWVDKEKADRIQITPSYWYFVGSSLYLKSPKKKIEDENMHNTTRL